jgi:hypothetical protein
LRQARQRAAELLSAAAKNGADVEAATKQIELALSLEARLVLFPGMMQQPRDRLRVGRTPMKSLLIAGLFSALTINQANAQVYYNYPDWDRLSESARATYIAGAYDSLVSIATADTASAARHYSKCVTSRQLTNEQLAKNVRAFVTTRPHLQKGPVQGGLINYLVELCGAPPN